MTFHQFLLILKSRWKLMFFIFFLVVASTIALSLILPKQYKAITTVLVDLKSADPIYGIVPQAMVSTAYMATQVDVITSDRVAQRVVKLLKLDQLSEARVQWQEEGKGKGTIEQFLANALQKKLDVKPSRESNVISIEYKGINPDFAAAVANAFAEAYLEINLELKVDPAKQYANWFNERTVELRKEVEKAQTKVSTYQKENGIVATDERLDYENARLAELSTQIAAAQAAKADTSSREKQASGNTSTSQDVLMNPVIQALRADIIRQEAKLKELSSRFGLNHPEYQSALSELNELKNKLQTEMKQVANSMGSANNANTQREGEIRQALEVQKKRVLELRQERDEFSVLQKDLENAQRAYDMVTQRLSQTSLESQTQQTNVMVLTPADPPTEHASPKLFLNLVLAIFFGTLLSVACALLMELTNRRIRSADDFTQNFGLPVLAVLHNSKIITHRNNQQRLTFSATR
ncbi:chain length determinant protein EpsF [Ampullimonas aquatilis]|uniref:chain length determinant protein EpsF n=1 Tax=Ampullimonas aquatilis TaxID=1341549 RepID=UPI003C70E5D3